MTTTSNAVLLTLIAASGLWAQSATLAGRVLDRTQAAVPRTHLTLYGTQNTTEFSTESDKEGRYRFTGVEPGPYLLEATAPGLSHTESITIGSGEERALDLTLETLRLRANVTVTATGTPQSVDQVAKALDIVDRAQMDQRVTPTIAEAVRTVPGLRVSPKGGPGSFTTIQTRGLRSQDTAVLIDGFRFRDPSAITGDASSYLGDLLVVDAARVEVLRGAGSSLYGTNAMAGTLNIVTAPGGGAPHGSITLDGGGLGQFRGIADFSAGWRDRLQYSAGLAHYDVTEGVDGDDRVRNFSAQAAAQYRWSPKTLLGVRLWAHDGFLQLNASPYGAPGASFPASGQVPAIPLASSQQRLLERGLPYTNGNATFIPNLNDPDSRRDAHFVSTLVTLQQQLAPRATFRASYQGMSGERDNRDGPAGVRFPPQFSNSSIFGGRVDTVQLRADVSALPHQLISGGYEWEREDYRNLGRDFNPDVRNRVNALTTVTQQSHTAFLQDQIRMWDDRLQLSLSGRVQTFSLDRPEFQGGAPLYTGVSFNSPPTAYTGDAALSYFGRSTNTKWRAHVGNGYRVPSLYERFGTSFYGGFFSGYGDPRLRPERSISVDAGVDQYLAGGKVRVSATYFYTRLQEVIGFDFSGLINPATDPYGRFGGYRNTGGGLARGVETTVESRAWRGGLVTGSYTYTKALDRVSQFGDGTLRSPRIIEHQFTAVVTQQFGRNWQAAFDFVGGSDYLFPFSGRAFVFEGPKQGNAVIGYTRPLTERTNLKVYTKVYNLFGQTYFEDGFRLPNRYATVGLRFGF